MLLFACISSVALPVLSNCFDKTSALSYYFIDIKTCLQLQSTDCDVVREFEDIHQWKISAWNNTDSNFTDTMSRNAGILSGLYRPRSALARALYEKQRNDRDLRQLDKNEWYRIDKDRLSGELQSKFVQLGPDRETKEFISNSIDKSSWIWTQMWYLLARIFLKYFWSITDINGWLGRGSMFVLSEEQVSSLCGEAWLRDGGDRRRSLVDVGAGDGEVTRRWAGVFHERYATELSASMRKLLAAKAFTVLDADRWWQEGRRFDCVGMLNLLDRCSRPRTLLQQARRALAPGGILMIALVLPFKPYVEVTADHKPEETLPVTGEQFEEQVTSFVQFMLEEMSFELVRWSRVPYLCEGDVTQSYYWLDDSVYTFRLIETFS